MEAYKTFELLKEHVRAMHVLGENYVCSNVYIIVEPNLGFEAEHLFSEFCDKIQNSSLMCEPGIERIGVLTTPSRKVAYVGMNHLLCETRIFIDREGWMDCGKNRTTTMLLEQLSFFGFAFTRLENIRKKRLRLVGDHRCGRKNVYKYRRIFQYWIPCMISLCDCMLTAHNKKHLNIFLRI